MNPISILTGAAGALVRSTLGWWRNRSEAKQQGKKPPKWRWGRFLESALEGAVSSVLNPDPASALVIGYLGSDAMGKGLRMIPGVRRIMPSSDVK